MSNVTWEEVNGLITMMVKIELEKEREAIAKLCEEEGKNTYHWKDGLAFSHMAKKIRARQ